tara:strand:+ start:615 stop:770 length:156 start_codon:yes stop_codon:yes gene_type:complete
MNFIPTSQQTDGAIYPAYKKICEICEDLQEEIKCPDAFIKGMLASIAGNYE